MLSKENNLTFLTAVKNQYLYKLRRNADHFSILVILQLVAAVFSIGSSAATGTGCENIQIMFHVVSPTAIQFVTAGWALLTAGMLTTRASRDLAFSIPGNRRAVLLSDFIYILTGCVGGGALTALLALAIRVPCYFLYYGNVMYNGFSPDFSVLCTVAAYTALLMLLLASIGYLVGTLLRSRVLFVIAAAAVIAVEFFLWCQPGIPRDVIAQLGFLFKEANFGLFTLKIIPISLSLILAGMLLSLRMEVRK